MAYNGSYNLMQRLNQANQEAMQRSMLRQRQQMYQAYQQDFAHPTFGRSTPYDHMQYDRVMRQYSDHPRWGQYPSQSQHSREAPRQQSAIGWGSKLKRSYEDEVQPNKRQRLMYNYNGSCLMVLPADPAHKVDAADVELYMMGYGTCKVASETYQGRMVFVVRFDEPSIAESAALGTHFFAGTAFMCWQYKASDQICGVCDHTFSESAAVAHMESMHHILFCPPRLQEVSTVWKNIQRKPSAGVMLICSKVHADLILENFGPPTTARRLEVQCQISLPVKACTCSKKCKHFMWQDPAGDRCAADCPLLVASQQTIPEEVIEYGKTMRNDVTVQLRPFMQKGVLAYIQRKYRVDISQAMADREEDWHVICSVALPCPPPWRSKSARHTYYHTDVGITANGKSDEMDRSNLHTAQREMVEELKAIFCDTIWSVESQEELRAKMGIEKLPVSLFWQPRGFMTYVLIVPAESKVEKRDGNLHFSCD